MEAGFLWSEWWKRERRHQDRSHSRFINQTWKWHPITSAIPDLSEESQYVQPTLKGWGLHRGMKTKMQGSLGALFQAVYHTLLDHFRLFRRNLAKAQEERKLEILLATVLATNHQAKTKNREGSQSICWLSVHSNATFSKKLLHHHVTVVPPPMPCYIITLFDFHHYMTYSHLFAYWLCFS